MAKAGEMGLVPIGGLPQRRGASTMFRFAAMRFKFQPMLLRHGERALQDQLSGRIPRADSSEAAMKVRARLNESGKAAEEIRHITSARTRRACASSTKKVRWPIPLTETIAR